MIPTTVVNWASLIYSRIEDKIIRHAWFHPKWVVHYQHLNCLRREVLNGKHSVIVPLCFAPFPLHVLPSHVCTEHLILYLLHNTLLQCVLLIKKNSSKKNHSLSAAAAAAAATFHYPLLYSCTTYSRRKPSIEGVNASLMLLPCVVVHNYDMAWQSTSSHGDIHISYVYEHHISVEAVQLSRC